MLCPFCQEEDTKVIDSRLAAEGNQIRRRRLCSNCDERFTTFETVHLSMPKVIKQNGSRQAFDTNKLKLSLAKALEKRPVTTEKVESSIEQILRDIKAAGESEIASKDIGQMIMSSLQKIDHVAYVRFASVYKNFQDLDAFAQEISKLNHSPKVEQSSVLLSNDDTATI